MIKLAPDVVVGPGDVIALAPNELSVRHWDGLLVGFLYASRPGCASRVPRLEGFGCGIECW